MQWKSLESTSGEDHQCIRYGVVFTKRIHNHWVTVIIIKYILTSKSKQKVKIKKHTGETSTHTDMIKYLAKLDWNNMLRNKTAIEC